MLAALIAAAEGALPDGNCEVPVAGWYNLQVALKRARTALGWPP